MKPARGSDRPASKHPTLKNNKKQQAAGKQEPKETKSQTKTAKKRKADTLSSNAKKVKAQGSWKPMPASSLVALKNMMDLALLSTLGLNKRDKEGIPEHLNTIKTRFLSHCAQLKVPVQRQKEPQSSSHYCCKEEAQRAAVGKKSLSTLEEDLLALVVALDNAEEQTVSIEQTCSSLRDQVEEEEEKAKKILQMRGKTVLNLPPYKP